MEKKNDEGLLQIGNFLVSHEDGGDGDMLCVRSVSGSWRLSWRDDSVMYAAMSRLCDDEKCHPYIEALLTVMFACTSYPHDLAAAGSGKGVPFMNGFVRLIDEQTQLEVQLLGGKASAEEEKEALEEVVRMHDVMDELRKLDEEDGEG